MSDESTTPDLVEIVTGLFEASHRGDIAGLMARPDTDLVRAVAERLTEVRG